MPVDGLALAFLAAAAVVQAALAVLVARRAGRQDWMWAIATHLSINAGVAAYTIAIDLEWLSQWGHAGPLLDVATGGLILFLALSFPHPARGLLRPLLARLAVAVGPPAALLTLVALGVPAFTGSAPHESTTWGGRLLVTALPAVAWSVLLVRWSPLLLRVSSPLQQRRFLFIYGAYAIRAAHMAVVVPLLQVYRWQGPAPLPTLVVALPAWGAMFAALVAAGVYLSIVAARHAGLRRWAATWATAMLGFGIIEAVLSLGPAIRMWLGASPMAQIDLYALRPIFLWLALVHLGTPAPRPAARTATLAGLGALAALAFAMGVSETLEPLVPDANSRGALAGALGILVAAPVAALALPRLLQPVAIPGLASQPAERERVERFLAVAEEAYQAPRGRTTDLKAEATRIGLSQEQAAALEAAVASGWAAGAGPWVPGQLLKGRFRLVRRLGGGLGETWLANDELGGGPVALKRAGRLDEAGRQSIVAEWEVLRVGHPRLVEVRGIETVGREPVLVMPYYAGGSLVDVAAAGPIPVTRAVALLEQLLEGLEAVHGRGLIHGDVKPANVLLDAQRQAVLADFGSARTLPAPGDPTLSAPQQATLRYLAPEQARGRAGGPQADVYAAALVFCTLVAGRHPIPDGIGPGQTLALVRRGLAPRLPRGVPANVAACIRRALAADPSRRFADAHAFRAELLRSRAKQQQAPSNPHQVAWPEGDAAVSLKG